MNASKPDSVLLPFPRKWRGTNPMDRADLFRVYELGAELHPLSNITNESTLGQFFVAYASAERAIAVLLGADPQIKVELCLQAARELKQSILTIEQAYFRDEKGTWKYPDDPNIKIGWYSYGLRSALQNFEAVFRAEMQTASTYLVPKRGALSTRDLVDAFDHSFLPDLHSTLDELALSEYRNAGRCFAFGLWTAAGYHACRSVEAVLRKYYDTMSSKETTDGKTWGTLIEDLEKETDDPKPNEKTLFYLRQLKDNERNPLMHVRVVLDEQDADLLLGSAKIAMVLMARELIAADKALTELVAATPLLAIEGDKA